jgi:hypothetical protein
MVNAIMINGKTRSRSFPNERVIAKRWKCASVENHPLPLPQEGNYQ